MNKLISLFFDPIKKMIQGYDDSKKNTCENCAHYSFINSECQNKKAQHVEDLDYCPFHKRRTKKESKLVIKQIKDSGVIIQWKD